MNVRELFEQSFPSVVDEFSDDDLKDMAAMPVDSTCGDACKAVIEKAKALDDTIREGHGEYYWMHRAHTHAIARVAVDMSNLYICG